MKRLSYTQARRVGGVLLVAILASGANYHLNLGLFGRFGRSILILSIALTLMMVAFLPSKADWERQKKLSQSDKS